MATPKLDKISLLFAEVMGDQYQDDGTLITTADQDGQLYTHDERASIVVHAINWIIRERIMAAMRSQSPMMELAKIADELFDYRTTASISLTASGNIATGSLPSSFAQLLSARFVRQAGDKIRSRLASDLEFENAAQGNDPEYEGVALLRFLASTVEVVYNDSVLALNNNDSVAVTYLAFQPIVTQGGATDIEINESWNQEIVSRMKDHALEFLNQTQKRR